MIISVADDERGKMSDEEFWRVVAYEYSSRSRGGVSSTPRGRRRRTGMLSWKVPHDWWKLSYTSSLTRLEMGTGLHVCDEASSSVIVYALGISKATKR